jgi:hypothetical protein
MRRRQRKRARRPLQKLETNSVFSYISTADARNAVGKKAENKIRSETLMLSVNAEENSASQVQKVDTKLSAQVQTTVAEVGKALLGKDY